MRSIRVMIRGRVQGVGYRDWCRRTADGLGLAGWVRNRADGGVEAVFSGGADSVEAMLGRCREGPGWARVEAVTVIGEAPPATGGFAIRATR